MKKNILANYIGQFWSAVMTVGFVPIYVAKLGPEAFGLIGVLTTLQACFTLLDLGMSPVIGREMARYAGGQHGPLQILSLLRSIEVLALALGLAALIIVYAASSWIATNWLNPVDLEPDAIASLLTVMGAIVGLRMLESVYRAVLTGLQHNVDLNIGIVIIATLRGLGSVAVIMLIDATIHAFLLWQLACSILAVILCAWLSYRRLPKTDATIAFDLTALRGVWGFAAGMTMINVLAMLLTQADKIILSKFLPLSDFGTYALAATIAAIPQLLIAPVVQAVQPRLTMQVAANAQADLAASFHTAAQAVSVLMGAAAIVLIAFSSLILDVWFYASAAPPNTAHLVAILALGNLLNSLMLLPYISQLANGWTSLAVRSNLIAVIVLLPALVWIAPRYGAVGAAWVWVALNVGYIILQSHVMFRRILTAQKWTWLLVDVARPLTAAIVVALIAKQLQPEQLTSLQALAFLSVVSAATLAAAALAAPEILHRLRSAALLAKRPV